MTTANKHDKRDKKPAMQFVHPRLSLGCGNAMGAGEIKYGGWNFLLGHGRMQLLAAIERHTACMKLGELIDADTTALWGATVYHSDCIAACLNMMYWQEEYGTLIEDRPIGVVEGVVTFAKLVEMKEEDRQHPDQEKIGIGSEVIVLEALPSQSTWGHGAIVGSIGVVIDKSQYGSDESYTVQFKEEETWSMPGYLLAKQGKKEDT